MTEDDYDYGVRLSDGSMLLEDVSLDYALSKFFQYNMFERDRTHLYPTVVRAPARVWEEFE
jgi:hypothetical protein